MDVTFHGVRGSVPTSGPQTLDVGGQTSCVRVAHGGHTLLLDAGTGLRAAGAALGPGPHRLTLLLSHLHWDHIQGFPFFGPAYQRGTEITVVCIGAAATAARAFGQQMRAPAFPVPLRALPATLRFVAAPRRGALELGPFTVRALDLQHPDRTAAWRVEAGGRRLVYATDHEHGERLFAPLLDFAAGADLLIHDAQYTDAEWCGEAGPSRRGWGHSTWQQAVGAAQAAGAARLALFHHDPDRAARAVAGIETMARARFPAAFAAREGETVAL